MAPISGGNVSRPAGDVSHVLGSRSYCCPIAYLKDEGRVPRHRRQVRGSERQGALSRYRSAGEVVFWMLSSCSRQHEPWTRRGPADPQRSFKTGSQVCKNQPSCCLARIPSQHTSAEPAVTPTLRLCNIVRQELVSMIPAKLLQLRCDHSVLGEWPAAP